jgi:hypothetical protein
VREEISYTDADSIASRMFYEKIIICRQFRNMTKSDY